MRQRLATAFVIASVLVGAGSAQAGPVLDQAFVPPANEIYASLDYFRAQTFTAGSGGQLVWFDVLVESLGVRDFTARFGIYPTLGGAPDLRSSSLAFADIVLLNDASRAWYRADVSSSGLTLDVGSVYAIVFQGRSVDGNVPYWVGETNVPLSVGGVSANYLGGTAFWSTAGGGPWSPLTIDLGFKTWVEAESEPPTVPEPGTLVLLLSGIAAIARCTRGRS